MHLDKSRQYVYRIGSDNQHRIYWSGQAWNYEFLAGGVLFDQQSFTSQDELEQALSVHGLNLNTFSLDSDGLSAHYSQEIQERQRQLIALGILPCAKHGLISKNLDGSCEACHNTDYPDDFKGTEG